MLCGCSSSCASEPSALANFAVGSLAIKPLATASDARGVAPQSPVCAEAGALRCKLVDPPLTEV